VNLFISTSKPTNPHHAMLNGMIAGCRTDLTVRSHVELERNVWHWIYCFL